jgi:hypothetical protein
MPSEATREHLISRRTAEARENEPQLCAAQLNLHTHTHTNVRHKAVKHLLNPCTQASLPAHQQPSHIQTVSLPLCIRSFVTLVLQRPSADDQIIMHERINSEPPFDAAHTHRPVMSLNEQSKEQGALRGSTSQLQLPPGYELERRLGVGSFGSIVVVARQPPHHQKVLTLLLAASSSSSACMPMVAPSSPAWRPSSAYAHTLSARCARVRMRSRWW